VRRRRPHEADWTRRVRGAREINSTKKKTFLVGKKIFAARVSRVYVIERTRRDLKLIDAGKSSKTLLTEDL